MQVLRDHVPSILAHTNLQQAGGEHCEDIDDKSGWFWLGRNLAYLEG